MSDHDQKLAIAFDSQAPKFEVAPIQSDPAALERLVAAAGLRPASFVLDAGCGPGLVSAAFLQAGHRVLGVDLSREMIERARKRCEAFGDSARFIQGSAYDASLDSEGPFDAAISRYVVHHVEDPVRFVGRQVALLRPGGILIINDHVTDPDPTIAAHHAALEVARDKTHTRNLTGGEFVDVLARVGLVAVTYAEEPFTLDFDEWFDRGTPAQRKSSVRESLLGGPKIRSFRPQLGENGSVRIDCFRAIVRGVKPR